MDTYGSSVEKAHCRASTTKSPERNTLVKHLENPSWELETPRYIWWTHFVKQWRRRKRVPWRAVSMMESGFALRERSWQLRRRERSRRL